MSHLDVMEPSAKGNGCCCTGETRTAPPRWHRSLSKHWKILLNPCDKWKEGGKAVAVTVAAVHGPKVVATGISVVQSRGMCTFSLSLVVSRSCE